MWRRVFPQELRCPGLFFDESLKERRRTGTFVPVATTRRLTTLLGVETGNWHLFPIDNPFPWARMAIAGARALSFLPG
jgi:hypothetical protein